MTGRSQQVVLGAVATLSATAVVWSLVAAFGATTPRTKSMDHAPVVCHASQLRVTLGPTKHSVSGSTTTPIDFHNLGPTCALASSAPSVTLGNATLLARFDAKRGTRTNLLLPRDSSASSLLLTRPVPEHQLQLGPLVCVLPSRLMLGVFGYAEPRLDFHFVPFSGLLVCLDAVPRLTTTPFTLKVNGTKFLAADLTRTNGWGRDAPAQILAVLRRDSAMPLGAPGSSLYAKLGTLSSLPIAEIDQIMGANLILSEQKLSRFTTSIVNPTTRLWFIVELNARLRPLGCPPFSRQLCSTRPMWGTWVSVVDNSNNHVLFTASF